MVTKWELPSFDPPKPKVEKPVVRMPTVEEVEAIRAAAYQESFDLGRQEGYDKGHAEGLETGREEGEKKGFEQAYAEAKEQIENLNQALTVALQIINDLPTAMAEPVNELAYTVGERLSSREGMDRGPFVHAVQEALMRLPRPGETLFFRIRAEELETWKHLIEDPNLPFKCTLVTDTDLPPGHAYVEVDGARLNVGFVARRALVRTALGLDLQSTSDEPAPVTPSDNPT
jgi:flagellar assembly protein FliH